ncbi:MAG: hypothetical protein RL172_1253 [Bacteroidota bacterium]|jgi:hypothetical protein
MKKIMITAVSLLLVLAAAAQAGTSKNAPDAGKPLLTVDASCGECKFGLKGESCDLAVKIDGKAYFVDGSQIDEHGDAHAKDGFCNAVRKAQVQGEIKDNRFVATYFKLLPVPAKSKNKKG